MRTLRRLIAAAAAAIPLLLILTVPTPTTAHADYSGIRWGRTDIICARLAGGSKPAYLVDRAIKRWNDHPDVRIFRKGDCSTYPMRIIINEHKYGTTASAAWTRYEGTTYPTPCRWSCDIHGYYQGYDTTGVWAWQIMSPVVIRINTSKRWTYASYEAMVGHELGHALGLSHTSRCDSVMSTTCYGRKALTAYDNAEIERIYPW